MTGLFFFYVQHGSENITCIKSLSFGLVLFMLVLPLKLEKKKTNYPHKKKQLCIVWKLIAFQNEFPSPGSALAGKYHIAMH